jgi:ferredoxin--NADP+ reductase
VRFRDWKKIEEAEIANAPSGSPREKFGLMQEMIAATQGWTQARQAIRWDDRNRR